MPENIGGLRYGVARLGDVARAIHAQDEEELRAHVLGRGLRELRGGRRVAMIMIGIYSVIVYRVTAWFVYLLSLMALCYSSHDHLVTMIASLLDGPQTMHDESFSQKTVVCTSRVCLADCVELRGGGRGGLDKSRFGQPFFFFCFHSTFFAPVFVRSCVLVSVICLLHHSPFFLSSVFVSVFWREHRKQATMEITLP